MKDVEDPEIPEEILEVQSEIDKRVAEQRQALERTWGRFLLLCNPVACVGFTGECSQFTLKDIRQIVNASPCDELKDASQEEEIVIMQLQNGNYASVWVSHCLSDSCCGACCNAVTARIGPTLQHVVNALTKDQKKKLGMK